jgi:hypothetical protein
MLFKKNAPNLLLSCEDSSTSSNRVAYFAPTRSFDAIAHSVITVK